MKIWAYLRAFWPVYLCCSVLVLALALGGRRAVEVISSNDAAAAPWVIVLDAGHGGEDGGAVSCTGTPESQINLQITLRLQALLHLLGYDTLLLRDSDQSLSTEGKTIAQRKVSDMKNRVTMVNSVSRGLLISIHQNTFPQARYHGAQVFYNTQPGARELAQQLQSSLVQTVNPGSRRKAKQARELYLMDRSSHPAILVECGFLSNPQEEALLRQQDYQQRLCCVIASAVSRFLNA